MGNKKVVSDKRFYRHNEEEWGGGGYTGIVIDVCPSVCEPAFSPVTTMFSTLSRKNSTIQGIFNLFLFANAFNLDQSNILSSHAF